MKTFLLALFVTVTPLVSSYAAKDLAIDPTIALVDPSLDRLKEVVNTNSGSANMPGVLAVQGKFKTWFEELGFTVSMKPNPDGEKVSAPLLLAVLPGQKPEAITLIMHADTVFEPSSPFQTWEMKNPKQMGGPGAIDDKGGVIVALAGLKNYLGALKAAGQKPKYTLQVEITPNEEVGATGWAPLFKELSQKSWMALSFEPSFEGGIVEGRKGNVWYEISVTGKEAHAGVNHKTGINACAILADKISKIQKLTDYKRNYTTSIGHIEGGQDKYNIVCGWAKAKVDTRVPSIDVRNEMNKRIEAILKDPAVTFKIVDETAPMAITAVSKPYVQKYLDAIQKVEGGPRPVAHFSGGVGDANHFARDGIVILDGLGPRGANMHTAEEYIEVESIASRAKVFSDFLLKL